LLLPIAEPFETMVVYGSEAVLALGIVTMLAQGRPLFRGQLLALRPDL
jgi:hypothetical protein